MICGDVWLTVRLLCQGAWGGSLLMSRRHRWKLDGVERQVTFFFSGWTSMYWKLTSALTNDAWWLILLLQGQFSNMEPTQDDVSPSAVFCPAGPRGGRLHPLSFMVLFCYGSVEHINIPESLSLDRVWCRTATRCTPATSSSRTNTTTFPTTLETKPCSVDAMWTSSSCGSCGEPR